MYSYLQWSYSVPSKKAIPLTVSETPASPYFPTRLGYYRSTSFADLISKKEKIFFYICFSLNSSGKKCFHLSVDYLCFFPQILFSEVCTCVCLGLCISGYHYKGVQRKSHVCFSIYSTREIFISFLLCTACGFVWR